MSVFSKKDKSKEVPKEDKQPGFLTRDALLEKQPLTIEKVDLGENTFVYVREMTGRERDQFERSMYIVQGSGKDTKIENRWEDFRAKLAVRTICDIDGSLILKLNDYVTLSSNMGAGRLEKIVNAAQKLNKITEEDKKGLVKNLKAGQAGNSNLDSAGTSE